jgi:hypothetical protein
MMIRSILAVAVGGSIAMTFATNMAQAQDEATAAGCPGLAAHIIISDYDGDHLVQMCVASQGLSIEAGVVNLHVYDNASDGIFHNGFDPAT